jgi:hypothetical protein
VALGVGRDRSLRRRAVERSRAVRATGSGAVEPRRGERCGHDVGRRGAAERHRHERVVVLLGRVHGHRHQVPDELVADVVPSTSAPARN